MASTVASNIRAARVAAGMKQRDLATALDVEHMTVSRWERGVVQPSADNLVRLAVLFDRDPSSFHVKEAA